MGFNVSQRFGTRLRQVREARNLRQEDLARMVRDMYGVSLSPTAVLRIEKGERPVKLDEAVALVYALGTSLEAMWEGPSEDLEADIAEAEGQVRDAERVVAEANARAQAAAVALANARQRYRRLSELLIGAAGRPGDPLAYEARQEIEHRIHQLTTERERLEAMGALAQLTAALYDDEDDHGKHREEA